MFDVIRHIFTIPLQNQRNSKGEKACYRVACYKTLAISPVSEFSSNISCYRVVMHALFKQSMGEIDWEHPGIHRGNLITCAGSERVTDRVCSIK